MTDDMARPDGPGSREPSPNGLGPPGFDPSRSKKIKGFTEQQTRVLLWLGTEWRRVRKHSNLSRSAIKSVALRPYVETNARVFPVGWRFSARLTPLGIELLARLSISDPPFIRDREQNDG